MGTEVHSDWGDWLVRRIERASPDGVAVWFLGGNGFALKDCAGTVLLIDPYLGTGDLHVPDRPETIRMIPVPFDPKDFSTVDALFVTHEHSDHCHEASQAPLLAGTGTPLYAPSESISRCRDEETWHEGRAIDPNQFHTITAGETVSVGAFDVIVADARDPAAVDPVSYVVEHEAGTFFHAGDGRPSDAFETVGDRYEIDLGAVALGTSGRIQYPNDDQPRTVKFYNDGDEVIKIANQLRLDALLPSHYDLWRGVLADPKALHEHAHTMAFPRRLEIARIGDRLDLTLGG
jgi:L-ascorbate 6-phosphate lactonase